MIAKKNLSTLTTHWPSFVNLQPFTGFHFYNLYFLEYSARNWKKKRPEKLPSDTQKDKTYRAYSGRENNLAGMKWQSGNIYLGATFGCFVLECRTIRTQPIRTLSTRRFLPTKVSGTKDCHKSGNRPMP